MRKLSRRQMVASSVTVFGTAPLLLGSEAEGQQLKPQPSGPFSVSAGESRGAGPWLIHGEKAFAVKIASSDVEKRYTLIEIHTPPGLGPELHVHPAQNEFFYITRGLVGIQCGSDRHTLRVGDSFMAPLGVPHSFVILGSEPAVMLNLFEPAGGMEEFFADYAPLISVEGEPDRKKLKDVYEKYGLRIVGPPLQASSFA